MSNQQTVSVAIATYNGEKYLEEQLVSILRQTRPVQEIVISDDGSKDDTLAAARRVAESPEAKDVRFVFLQDNPRHGAGGNFEWAIKHCSGDYIFICGQDDVWLPNKVQCILEVYNHHKDAYCVLHNAGVIDSSGSNLNYDFMNHPGGQAVMSFCGQNELTKLDESLLETALHFTPVSGIAITMRRCLLEEIFPIPDYMEDQWIEFVAIALGGCFFLNKELQFYRIHENNISRPIKAGSSWLKKAQSMFADQKRREQMFLYQCSFTQLACKKMTALKMEDHPAYQTAQLKNEVLRKREEARVVGGIAGVFLLLKLYKRSMRYRHSGTYILLADSLAAVSSKHKKETT